MLLLFPTEIGIDKKHLPWLTIGVALIIALIYFSFQIHESDKINKVVDFYHSSGLQENESDLFQRYLETPTAKQYYNERPLQEDAKSLEIYYRIFDKNFRKFVSRQLESEQPSSSEAQEKIQKWFYSSQNLKTKINDIPSYRFGAYVSESFNISIFTHMFLHSGVEHLFFNLVFLVLFGLGVERLFGRTKWLIIYCVSGALGAVLFTLLEGKPYMPLVGASGAISGLMGAYIAYYGTQRIQFLVWLGFYFNHFKLPALAILGYWILKELFYQLTDLESNVAYLAHLGGLMTGGFLGFLLKPGKKNLQQESKLQNSFGYQKHYKEALEHIRQLNIEHARKCLNQALKLNPKHAESIKSLYNLEKVNPKSEHYKSVVNQVLSFDLINQQIDSLVLEIVESSIGKHINIKDLNIDAFFGLLHGLLRNDRLQKSTPLVENAKKDFAQHPKLPELLFHWSITLAKRNQIRAASIELNYLANYYGETEFGKNAKTHLEKWKGSENK
ncbi:rhomboid family intramembrane serine protease [Pleionea sediminis]|uniref:rhomboid family intramembrane serine protease n=1 Tax=Pleionea sediminis TaxID=2569479 RepID=UPI001186BD3A|nr:rhomboid family intramembrane serine protease [Pleionea sediminis]